MILAEINDTAPDSPVKNWDAVRRKYLSNLFEVTGRNVVVYASNWMQGTLPSGVSIDLADMEAFMECYNGLDGGSLDLVLHSPGGDPNAAASIVRYTRKMFTDVRVIVPLAAMSAATMMSFAAEVIVMGKHSQLGPIDPQLITPRGAVPAASLRRQFETAKLECADDPRRLSAWLPTLQQFYPGMLELCSDAEALAVRLSQEWLAEYMFAGRRSRKSKAMKAVKFFSDSDQHKSHALGIDRDTARKHGLVIEDLEADELLQDAVLSVHHATTITLQQTGMARIVDNHLGRTHCRRAPAHVQSTGA